MQEKQRGREQDIIRYLSNYDLDHAATGFSLLIDCVSLLLEEDDLRRKRRMMPVYNAVAEKHGCKYTRVERAIRLLLEKAKCGMVTSSFCFKMADELWLASREDPP